MITKARVPFFVFFFIVFAFVNIVQAQQNVALNKPATQSSDLGGDLGYATAAVDGYTDGNWNTGSVTHTAEVQGQGTTDPWWEVDLGKVYEITKYKIYGRTDCCGERLSGFRVSTRNSTSDQWENLYTGPELQKKRGRKSPQTNFQMNFNANDPPTARYLRIQLPGQNRILSLAEVEILGAEVGTMVKPMDRCKTPPGPGEARIFTLPNYRGECGTFTYKDDGPYPYSVEAKFDDPKFFAYTGISTPFYSIKVGSGIEVTICPQKSLRGNCVKLTQDRPILSGFTRGVQSVKIYTLTPKKYVNPNTPNDDQVTVCSNPDHGGGCRKVGQGDYDFNSLSYQSILIGKNVKVQIYFQRSYYGNSRTLSSTGKPQRVGKFYSMRVLSVNENRINDKFRRRPTPIPVATPVPVATPAPIPTPTPVGEERGQVVGWSTPPIGGEGYTGPDSKYKFCAKEGENCKYSGEVRIAYGVGEQFSIKRFTSPVQKAITCNENNFGDPAPRLPKRCYIWQQKRATINHAPPVTSGSPYVECSPQNQRCNFPYIGDVAFGVNGVFNYKRGVTRGIDCNVATFGDPAPGMPKKCYSKFVKKWVPNTTPTETDKPSPPNSNFRVCGVEGRSCTFQGTGRVAYGYNEKNGRKFLFKQNVNGSIACNNQTFGGDPAPGKDKVCYVQLNN